MDTDEKRSQVIRMLTKTGSRSPPLFGGRKVRGRSHELYRETGENFRSVRIEITDEHLKLDTHDMGRATEEYWGDSDYEFWTVIERSEWAKLLTAFAKEAGAEGSAADPATWSALSDRRRGALLFEVTRVWYEGDSRATDRLRDLCKEHGVEYSGGSWV
jgi:hypothetical protein